mmetsp:Transcript_12262/g.21248  ORF Transcript_12262/g.21248 Transcript_12262/m.21248 type:complete len:83 (+) Transcript_12262:77-325(+)
MAKRIQYSNCLEELYNLQQPRKNQSSNYASLTIKIWRFLSMINMVHLDKQVKWNKLFSIIPQLSSGINSIQACLGAQESKAC